MPELDERAHSDPDKWCQAPLCKDTNWGGYNRLHVRGENCPPYNPNPEPNPSAEAAEAMREVARENARTRDTHLTPEGLAEMRMHHSEALLWISALEWWITLQGLTVPTWRDVEKAGWSMQRIHQAPTLGEFR